ncbi:MAG: redoxin domain-containing protein [Planctomycetota bacterium]|jgi:peroxiredoxin
MHIWKLAAFGILAVASVVIAQEAEEETPDTEELQDVRQAPKPVDPRQHRIGQQIPDVEFTDVTGKAGKLSDYADKKAVVVMVTNVGCPICKKFAPTINEIVAEYKDSDVAFLLLNPMESDEAESVADAIKRYKFSSRYIHQPTLELARELMVNSTGDSFVLDATRTLKYRGAIDDQYGFGYNLDAPRKNYLRDALASVLAGTDVETPATWAPGCDFEVEAPKPSGKITWHNRVSRIVQDNCQECHREGENGPFPLMKFKDVKGNRAMVKRQVKQRLMPPWFADSKTGHFANDRSLSDDDRQALIDWIDNGTPEGDAKDAPLPKKFAKGWKIGTPDESVTLKREFDVPAKGTVPYQYRRVKTSFGEDKWVQAMEIRASAPQVVHHVLVFLKYPKGHPRADEQPDDMGGINGYFMGMVPGQGHITFPKGQGKFLPKGATVIFQIHYTAIGEEASDKPTLGMIFCKERPETEIQTIGVTNNWFAIPPGADNHKVTSAKTFKNRFRLQGFMPHMHVRGKAYRYEVVYPDGKKELLLDIPRYDFNWQLVYTLREPLDLPKGSKIIATGWFDNSDKNPANPDPKKTVRFGEQTWDEMQIGYINGYWLE